MHQQANIGTKTSQVLLGELGIDGKGHLGCVVDDDVNLDA
jgi:hypothetical protein